MKSCVCFLKSRTVKMNTIAHQSSLMAYFCNRNCEGWIAKQTPEVYATTFLEGLNSQVDQPVLVPSLRILKFDNVCMTPGSMESHMPCFGPSTTLYILFLNVALRLGATVNFTLPFMTNVTISISTSQIFRS